MGKTIFKKQNMKQKVLIVPLDSLRHLTGQARLTLLSSTALLYRVDEVQIFNYALTNTQVKQLYNEGSAVRFGPITGTP